MAQPRSASPLSALSSLRLRKVQAFCPLILLAALRASAFGADLTRVEVTVSTNQVAAGGTVNLYATVSDVTHAATLPTGSVTFYDTAGPCCGNTIAPVGAQTISNGQINLTGYSPSGSGLVHHITATYTPSNSGFIGNTDNAGQLVSVGLGLTSTTLTLSASSFAAGSAVTLTAAVKSGNNAYNGPGQVSFCDATFPRCTDIHLLGNAQLHAGAASYKFIPGPGVHTYRAIFSGTTAQAASPSATATLTVVPAVAPNVVIVQGGSPGSSTVFSAVSGNGPAPPSGTISFLDTSNSNYVLGSGTLIAGTPALTLVNSQSPATGNFPVAVVTGDFNGDGKPDIAVANYGGGGLGSITILLGSGNGTFTVGPVLTGLDTIAATALGDFNNDGKLDLAVLDSVSPSVPGSVKIFLGNGDGTFTSGANPATGDNAQGIAVGDFNGDGNQDLAITNANSRTITILLGDGTGAFTASTSSPGTGNGPVSIVAVDLNHDGILDLAETDLEDTTCSILLGNGDGTFAPRLVQSLPNYSYALATADVNGDGNADLILAQYFGSATVVLLGGGDGTFTAASPNASTGSNPRNIVVADLNGDGIPDIITDNQNSGTLSILLGKGDGTFEPALNPAVGSDPQILAAADFDGDGLPDLVTGDYFAAQAYVLLTHLGQSATVDASILTPVGTGTHIVVALYPGDAVYASAVSGTSGITAQPVPTTITLAQSSVTSNAGQPVTLTATLSPDIAQNHSTTGQIVTFTTSAPGGTTTAQAPLQGGVASLTLSTLAAGENSFSATYGGNTFFTGSATGPVTHLVRDATTTTFAILSGGNATQSIAQGAILSLSATVLAGSSPVSPGQVRFCDDSAPQCTDTHLLGTAQLTAAGTATLKIAAARGLHAYHAVFLGTPAYLTSSSPSVGITGTGTYPTTATLTATGTPANYTLAATVTAPSPTAPTGSISFADPMGNTVLGTVPLSPLVPTLSLISTQTLGTGETPNSTVAADFNNDGYPDFATTDSDAGTVSIYLGSGNGSFTQAAALTALNNPSFVATADCNSDGIADLIVANTGTNQIFIFLGRGDGTFRPHISETVGATPYALTVADLNNDGIPDIAVANTFSNTVSILLGLGDGTFTSLSGTPATGNGPTDIVSADFNNDGNLDLAITNLNDATVTILLGNGDGTFTPATPLTGVGNSYHLVAADLNRDGNQDLAVANSSGNSVQIFLGDGHGHFTAQAAPLATGGRPNWIASADLNADGIPDLVTANRNTNDLSILFGRGDGTFQPAVSQSVGNTPNGIASADFNGDGFLDLVVANSGSSTASVLIAQFSSSATATLADVTEQGTGTYSAVAKYPGDNTDAPSTSNTVTLTTVPYPVAAAPAFSPGGGSYTAVQTVAIVSSTPNASVLYTLDGSTPTTASTRYTGPISVAATETIRAIATAVAFQASPVATAAYVINIPPALTAQPLDQTVNAGQSATLTALATGTAPLTYTWYAGQPPNTLTPVATGTAYTTPALTATSSFWVQVTNASNIPANSRPATVTVTTAPSIVSQVPTNPTINRGQQATLIVTTSGSPATFQWYAGQASSTSSPISGATAAVYTTPALTANAAFWVRASNSAGHADSASFLISVNQPPTCALSVQPTAAALTAIATSACSDPQSQTLTQTLDWGDGTVVPSAPTAVHTYKAPGSYTVRLTATDTSDLSVTATRLISPNQSPVCTLGVVQGQISGIPGQYPVSVTATCTDPQGQPLTTSIDWGDTPAPASTAINNATNTHTYTSNVAYPATVGYFVVLSATDTSGLTGSTAPLPVSISPAQVVPPGAATPFQSDAPPLPVPPPANIQVTFVCSSVSAFVNGNAVNNSPPSTFGISCTSPTILLTAGETPANVTIQTTSAKVHAANEHSTLRLVFAAVTVPFLGLTLFPKRRRRVLSSSIALSFVLLLCSCGGYFQVPPAAATPSGNYLITINEVVVSGTPPTGFVQTSLIVPLPVAAKP